MDKIMEKGTKEMVNYSNEEVVQRLKEFYAEYNTTSVRIYKDSKWKPAWNTVLKKFGSWENALREAGLYVEPNTYTKSHIIGNLKRLYEEHNGKVSVSLYNESNYEPSLKVIKKLFGSWNEALKEAELPFNDSYSDTYTEEEILERLRRYFEENDNYLSANLYKEKGYKPSTSSIRHKFGSWNRALELAGLTINQTSKKKYSKSEVISTLQKLADEEGYLTVHTYAKECSSPSLGTVLSMFGSWNEAIKAANLNEKIVKYDSEEMIKSLQEFAKEQKGIVSSKIYEERKLKPGYHAIIDRFGSWSKALEKAGIKPIYIEYTDEEILEELRRCAKELNVKTLKMEQYESCSNRPHSSTVSRRFGSWENALKNAGLVEK